MMTVTAVWFIAGCIDPATDEPPPLPYNLGTLNNSNEEADEPEPEPAPKIEVTEMDLYMHELEAGSEKRQPTIWVHADSGMLNPDRSWSLTRPEAVVYRKAEEDIHFSSDTGIFDDARRIAELQGNVQVQAGDLQMETSAFEWDDNKQLAKTDKGVTVRDGQSELEAQTVELRPETGTIRMTRVNGRLELRGLNE